MTILIIPGCKSELSVNEIYSFSKTLEEKFMSLNNNEYVQMITDRGGIKYIIINTSGMVTLEAESKANAVIFSVEETNVKSAIIERHIFKITLDKEYEYIELYRNGEQIAFDTVYGW